MEEQIVAPVYKNRIERLHAEFYEALAQLDEESLKTWGKESASIFLRAGSRRVKNFVRGVVKAGKFVLSETFGYTKAYFRKQLAEHFSERKLVYKDFADQKFTEIKYTISLAVDALKTNPRKEAPEIFFAFLGFLFGSGGLDGDGGVPDMDLMTGIGNHRSIFTHSIFSAIFIEAIAFSFIKLVELFYENLPDPHDRFWDTIIDNQKRLTRAFSNGACAGIAYHLLVDMNITAHATKPYADLPFSASMKTHQAIFGGNAVTEIVDLNERNKKKRINSVKNQDTGLSHRKIRWRSFFYFLFL